MPKQRRHRQPKNPPQPGAPVRGLASHVLPDQPLFVGAVAIAHVRNVVESAKAGDKPRPVVLCRRTLESDSWKVWGLTSNRTFTTGRRRTPSPWLAQYNILPGASYLWGANLAWVPTFDILGVVWAAPVELLEACAALGTEGVGPSWAGEAHEQHVEMGWSWPKPSRAARAG